eukprot:scaffold322979_cov31-Tisochrysis_lutea.AAC.3
MQTADEVSNHPRGVERQLARSSACKSHLLWVLIQWYRHPVLVHVWLVRVLSLLEPLHHAVVERESRRLRRLHAAAPLRRARSDWRAIE